MKRGGTQETRPKSEPRNRSKEARSDSCGGNVRGYRGGVLQVSQRTLNGSA